MLTKTVPCVRCGLPTAMPGGICPGHTGLASPWASEQRARMEKQGAIYRRTPRRGRALRRRWEDRLREYFEATSRSK